MDIRRAEEKDIPRILELLGQVLQIHADIRPDIFIPGTTKYTAGELAELLQNEERPIYVAVNEEDECLGYAFCQLKEQPFSNNMVPFTSLFIDDLCVDAKTRGQHIGEQLFEYVKNEYEAGIIACHNGRGFKYSSKQTVSKSLYNLYIGEYLDKTIYIW